MGQTYAAIDQSSQSGTAVLGHLDDRTDTLLSSSSGTSFPGSPVEGQPCYRTDEDVLYVYSDSAWTEVAVLGNEWTADAECSFQQLKEMRVENLAAAEAVAAGKDGHVSFNTGSGELQFIDQSTDNTSKQVRSVILGTTVQKLVLGQPLLDASNPPTAGFEGTTPGHRGWVFDAANELASWSVPVPADLLTGADLVLRLWVVLNQAEDNGDDIDWSCDLTSLVAGEPVNSTSTATAASLTDIGTDSSDAVLHTCDIALDFDDGDNPIVAGDLLTMEIHRTDLSEVGAVTLLAAALVYTTDGGVQ